MSRRCISWLVLFFFFSSRRRHTRFDCDWSSDVCSSDLNVVSGIVFVVVGIAQCMPVRFFWLRYTDASAQGRCLDRSEEHTSELQSQSNLVCRLLLEKKKKKFKTYIT